MIRAADPGATYRGKPRRRCELPSVFFEPTREPVGLIPGRGLSFAPTLAYGRSARPFLGVSHPTVAAVREDMETTGKIFQLPKTVGKDGKALTAPS